MNNRHLKIFVNVYELRNMTLAADALFISQPSVSQAIKELEDQYSTKLFERFPKRLYPTPQGDLLYKYAKQIFGLLDEARTEILALSEHGTISIGANISAGTVLIRKYIEQMKEQYPDVRVKVTIGGSAKLKQMIYEHTVDAALLEDLPHDPMLVQEPFYHDQIVVVCAPENPLASAKKLTLRDLAGCDLLLRNKGVGVRDKFDYLMNLYDIEVSPLWEASNTKSLINAVKDDLGVAVLPYLLVKDELDTGEVVRVNVKEDMLKRNLNIVYHKDKIFNKWLEAFIDIVKTTEFAE